MFCWENFCSALRNWPRWKIRYMKVSFTVGQRYSSYLQYNKIPYLDRGGNISCNTINQCTSFSPQFFACFIFFSLVPWSRWGGVVIM
jgi:hypothetical protein